jgi:hypothetical protein
MSASVSHHERRQFGRRPTFQHGWVKIPGRPPLTCVIRNISEGGALLQFDSAPTLPYSFLLDIESFGLTIGCEIRHHYGEKIGVQFVEPEDVQHASSANTDDVASWVSSKFGPGTR